MPVSYNNEASLEKEFILKHLRKQKHQIPRDEKKYLQKISHARCPVCGRWSVYLTKKTDNGYYFMCKNYGCDARGFHGEAKKKEKNYV